MCLNAVTAEFEAGKVLLPRTAPSLSTYRNELLAFPGSKFCDQVDSTTQALDHLKTRSGVEIWAKLGERRVPVCLTAKAFQQFDNIGGGPGNCRARSIRPATLLSELRLSPQFSMCAVTVVPRKAVVRWEGLNLHTQI